MRSNHDLPRLMLSVAVLATLTLASASTRAGTLAQTATFEGTTPEALYDLLATAETHAAITGKPVRFVRGGKPLAKAEVGAELQAFGGALTARVIDLAPGKRIVLSWSTFAWGMAVTRNEQSNLPSIVVLAFRKTAGGAQIELVQADVPDYTVRLPDGETGALSALVNTHWNTLYWDRLRDHLKTRSARPANRK